MFTDTTVPRPALATDLDVDVCVIGGGLAGLTAARELAKRRWSVAVLDAGQIAASASAHSMGLVAPGFAERPNAIIERVGRAWARSLWDLSAAGGEYVRTLALDSGVKQTPLDLAAGRLSVSRIHDKAATTRRAALLNDAFDYPAEVWPRARVQASLRSDRYFDAVHWPTAFCVSSGDYARKLAASAETYGARIFEGARAIAIDASGVRKRVETPSGRVRASHIVLATGALPSSFDPLLAGTFMPLVQELALSGPLGSSLGEAIKFPGAVDDPRHLGEGHRIIDGDRVLLALPLRISARGEARIARQARAVIARTYPGLANVPIAETGSYRTAFAVHRMPQIGEVSPGLWLAAAFASHGLNTTAMAGQLIACAIAEADDRWRLFSPYGLVWAGGGFGKTVVAVSMAAGRSRDRLHAALSRWRRPAKPPVSAAPGDVSAAPAILPAPADTAKPGRAIAVRRAEPPEQPTNGGSATRKVRKARPKKSGRLRKPEPTPPAETV